MKISSSHSVLKAIKAGAKLIAICTLTLAVSLYPTGVRADTLQVTEHRVTSEVTYETMPRLGNDGVSDLVVYTVEPVLPSGVFGSGAIWYQRLVDGAPVGEPVQVTDDPYNNQLNDVSGDYIVYTAYNSTSSSIGRIMVYWVSTGMSAIIGSALVIQEPRICGTTVVWREGRSGATEIMMYDLSWLGTSASPFVLAGPIPPTFTVDIGDRFVVWAQLVDGQYDVAAFDLFFYMSIPITSTTTVSEIEPSTDGPWIVWEAFDAGVQTSRIEARNMDTGEFRVLVDNGGVNYRPSISGDLVAYESTVTGNFDIFVYRLSTGESFQVTTDSADQYLNDVFGHTIAYADKRYGNVDIYAANLTFIVPPIAKAGANQTVHLGSLVTLDGSGSSDPNTPPQTPLTYAWSLDLKPNGSTAALTNPNTVNPTFRPDVMGSYTFSLTVTNAAGASSTPATVIISTSNSAPIAEAGPDQPVTQVGTTVHLDGSQSYDPDTDSITAYTWSFFNRPAGSNATLTGANTVTPTFVVDVHGDYVVQLVVSDGWISSAPDKVTISFANLKPVANAGTGGSAMVGDTVHLNGSASNDPNGDPLTFQWSLTAVPVGSQAAIVSPTAMITSFVPDLAGTYVAQLIVNDGYVNSDANTVSVLVIANESAAINAVKAVEQSIAGLPLSAFTNMNHGKTLINKLNSVIQAIEEHRYADALSQLQNDILKKVDGCATSSPPAPDKQDWINNCADQAIVYPIVIDAIQQVSLLM